MGTLQKLAVVIALLTGVQVQTSLAAQAETYGDWTTGSGKGFMYAATVNDSGLALGEYCYLSSKTCTWMIAIDSTCKEGDKYLSLGNTDQGAATLVMSCGGKMEAPERFVMLFQDWKSLEGLMQKSNRLGLAVPMQSDQFKVYRFSLNGMTKAQAVLEAAFFAIVAPSGAPAGPPKQNTSTSTL